MRDIKIFEFSIKCLEIDVFIQKKNSLHIIGIKINKHALLFEQIIFII